MMVELMPSVYDVPPDIMIKKLAEYLKDNVEDINPPSWSLFTKIGTYKENPPQQNDWWYIRCASLLRKLYLKSPLGISRLCVEYGGRGGRNASIEHGKKGTGSSVRVPLQQLEKAGFVVKEQKEGRKLSNEGRSLLDKMAGQLIKEMKSVKRSD
jgi:small subunit ribosomal protein S19e